MLFPSPLPIFFMTSSLTGLLEDGFFSALSNVLIAIWVRGSCKKVDEVGKHEVHEVAYKRGPDHMNGLHRG